MSTTKQEISKWFDEGVANGAEYMLVICDTFDYDDYPVFVNSAADCLRASANPGNMQKVMEVYYLLDGKEAQLNMRRTMMLPKTTPQIPLTKP